MTWSRDDFLSILNTQIANNVLQDKEISDYVSTWKIENTAALFHANGITQTSDIQKSVKMLQLAAAFGRKDIARMEELIHENVSVGVRLDYFLPLYDASNDGGEDMFVACVKAMLNGDAYHDIHINETSMMHIVGDKQGYYYDASERSQLEQYINNSFAIRKLLQSAPNKEMVQPNQKAIEYILIHSKTYRDSNDNPVIVFIPGAISINALSVPDLIQSAMHYGANVNDVGLFGVPGIVWSIILGDVDSVNVLLAYNAKLNMIDEMGNKHVMAWVRATQNVVADNPDYSNRLLTIMRQLQKKPGE